MSPNLIEFSVFAQLDAGDLHRPVRTADVATLEIDEITVLGREWDDLVTRDQAWQWERAEIRRLEQERLLEASAGEAMAKIRRWKREREAREARALRAEERRRRAMQAEEQREAERLAFVARKAALGVVSRFFPGTSAKRRKNAGWAH